MMNANFPKIALGAWAWGNDGTFGSGLDAADLKPIFDAGMKAGLNLWDTAYAYGMGTSEKVLGSFLQGLDRDRQALVDIRQLVPQRFLSSKRERARQIDCLARLLCRSLVASRVW